MHSLKTGKRRLLVERGSHARCVSSGHLLYASDGLLMAAPFDAERDELIGPAIPVIEGVMMTRRGVPALGHFAVSTSGSLAYISGPVRNSKQTLHWVDREGREESLNVDPRSYLWPQVSPDGTRVAVEVVHSGNRNVWIHDLVRKWWSQLTSDAADDGRPAWTPTSDRVVFRSNRDRGGYNLFWQRVDGTGQAERLTSEPNADRTAWGFTPDGKMLLVTQVNPDTALDLHLLSMERGYGLKPLLNGRFMEGSPQLSLDGRWIAYRSDQTGIDEIYVRPFPNVDDGRWQITTNGGAAPLWAPGSQLFYRAGDSMMMVPIDTEPTFNFGKPQVLFSKSYIANMMNVDLSADGRFLITKDDALMPESSEFDEISVVLNWTEELKRLVPPK